MQDRYAGDIGDFGKFQLLRFLFQDKAYGIKQIWYRYPDEVHNNDGSYINYFSKVQGFDSVLECSLKELVQSERSIKALQEANFLNYMEYYDDCVTYNGKDSLPYRKTWFKKATEFAQGADIICVDPDNGMATKRHRIEDMNEIEILSWEAFSKRSKAGKYIFAEEIQSLSKLCGCLIIYHHLNRTMPHNEQIKCLKQTLHQHHSSVLVIKHKPYSPRAYFFLCQDETIKDYVKQNLILMEELYSVHWEFSTFE